jgi:hypothetical protein
VSGWIVDVCRMCGRLAMWPFCAHREEPQADGRSWCESVAVGPMTERGRELARLNAERVTRERYSA